MLVDILEDPVWQMSWGEQAAVEGILSALRPTLAIEIGSMEGACLRRIAEHAGEVHSFDLYPPALEQPDNVTLHTGDSHELLPAFLAELAEGGRNIEFVMVDGDHTPEGVRQDLEDLLDSAAVGRTVILIHDTANERVRQGVDAVRFAAWPKVAHVELDWVPGRLFAEPGLRDELWYGLGLVLVNAERSAYLHRDVYEQRYHPLGPLLAEIRQSVMLRRDAPSPPGESPVRELRERVEILRAQLAAGRHREAEQATLLSALRDELAAEQAALGVMTERHQGAERALENIKGSASWKLTRPLRAVKHVGSRTGG